MIRWPFLLVSDLERLIREKAHVCEYRLHIKQAERKQKDQTQQQQQQERSRKN